ncbi:MAG: hypothetical protein WC668_00795 [Patescibacteria group bacterium]
MVIYICSAKSGDLENDRIKFNRIEAWLKEQEVNVVNPITFLDSQEVQLHLAERDAVDKKLIEKYGEERRCWFIQVLSLLSYCVSQCDAIYLEYDWQDDTMSILEYVFSQYFGLPSLMKIKDRLAQVEVNTIDLTKALSSLLPDSAMTVLTNCPNQFDDEDYDGEDSQGEMNPYSNEKVDPETTDNVVNLAASAEQNKMRQWLESQMGSGNVKKEDIPDGQESNSDG